MKRIKKLAMLLALLSISLGVSAQEADTTDREVVVESVTVKGKVRGNYINSSSLMKSEVVGRIGLQKMACCSAAESFENSATITVSNSDGVSGTKQVRMLGLNGMYTSLMSDGRLISRGLSAPYALSFTPGSWLSGIHISKGIAAVPTGNGAITGHINMQSKLPTSLEPLFINAYVDQHLRTELNATSSLQLNEYVSTSILGHYSMEPLAMDSNGDGFLDTPKSNLFALANNWDIYLPNSGIEIYTGAKYVNSLKQGGQMDFIHGAGGSNRSEIWGLQTDIEQLDLFFKLALPTDDKGSNLAILADYNYFTNNSFYGLKDYNARQDAFMFDAKYFWKFNDSHALVLGVAATADLVNESLKDNDPQHTEYSTGLNLDRDDITVGAFAEYTYTIHNKLTLITGARLDHANFYGYYFTPRLHMNWRVTPTTNFRVSGGLGYRPTSLISDNMAMLATGREIIIADDLDRMERGTSFGGSLTQSFEFLGDEKAMISFDVFHTTFENQVIADQEWDDSQVYLYNIKNGSWATAYQVDFNWSPVERMDILMTFRYNDTKINLANADHPANFNEVDKPLVDKFKGLVNIQYATKFRKWVFDFTAQVNGQQRLPSTVVSTTESDYTPIYPMLFAQVTKNFRKLSLYLGCENLLNFTQDTPVINPQSPFSEDFNASVVWGPLMGRKIYFGLRFTL